MNLHNYYKKWISSNSICSIKSKERRERIVNTKMIISSTVPLKKEEKKRSKNKNEVKRLSNPFGRFATGPTTRSDASNPVVERELVKRHFPRCKVPAISTGEMHPADASVSRRQTQTTIDFELTRNFDAP